MFRIRNLTLKNFLSVGAVTQSISFDNRGLTLILGENLDQGGSGARNGVGKSTIIQALSYALYDTGITQIKKDNLINKTNGKNMLVSVEFEINGDKYKVERGRKPNVFRFFVNGTESDDNDQAQGENRKTQIELTKVLGMSQDMFKHIVALSTYTQPFLFMRQNDQRIIIEELLSITLLSEKANVLKKQIRDTRGQIRDEEVRIKTIRDSNEGIEKTIKQLEAKSKLFEKNKERSITDLITAIDQLEDFDIDDEVEKHKELEVYNTCKRYQKQLSYYEKSIIDLGKRIVRTTQDLDNARKQICPTCGQEVHDNKHDALIQKLESDLADLHEQLDPVEKDYNKYKELIDELDVADAKPETFYSSVDDAYQHRQNLNQLKHKLEEAFNKENPYDDQILSLKNNALQVITYDKINSLKKYQEHQDFLFKLLTSKDSFIRKKIIDQNLGYLNNRLSYYLNKMGLPHDVEFKNNLTVEIVLLGQEFDFGQLSRGQQNRLILALSWAFRDVWEGTGHPINILFIDEMIDSGIDTIGVENTIEILKQKAREQKKDIFLISHKEELINRVHNVMMVVMENGFTSYSAEEA